MFLYFLLGLIAYSGAGTVCAKFEIDYMLKKGESKEAAAHEASYAFLMWPLWLLLRVPEITLNNYIVNKHEKVKLLREAEKEIEEEFKNL